MTLIGTRAKPSAGAGACSAVGGQLEAAFTEDGGKTSISTRAEGSYSMPTEQLRLSGLLAVWIDSAGTSIWLTAPVSVSQIAFADATVSVPGKRLNCRISGSHFFVFVPGRHGSGRVIAKQADTGGSLEWEISDKIPLEAFVSVMRSNGEPAT
jgi:hypothetical protein